MNTAVSKDRLQAFVEIAADFRGARHDRLGRDHINPNDFAALSAAGYLQLCVPEEMGGGWHTLATTGPLLAEIARELARGDPSVALVSAMHPAVVAYWHTSTKANPLNQLTDQAKTTFATALDGHWWGTVMSEPGSGGDVAKTKTAAVPVGENYQLSGQKHFGSGSGQTSFMITSARTPDDSVDLFVIDMRDKPWDGTTGIKLLRQWDGHGMAGTQSHAFELDNCPAQRAHSSQPFQDALRQVSSLSGVLFSAVIVGILDEAFDYAINKLRTKADGMRALERVELVRARNEHWQAVTLYSAVRDAMGSTTGIAQARQAKYAIAQHAENALGRLSKVVGGSSFSRSAPLGQWAQDVKALGFLRPPWALQNDQLFDAIWAAGETSSA